MKTLKGLLTDLKVWQLADKHADDPEGFMRAYRRADHADRVRLVRLLERVRDLKLALLRKKIDALLD